MPCAEGRRDNQPGYPVVRRPQAAGCTDSAGWGWRLGEWWHGAWWSRTSWRGWCGGAGCGGVGCGDAVGGRGMRGRVQEVSALVLHVGVIFDESGGVRGGRLALASVFVTSRVLVGPVLSNVEGFVAYLG